MKYLVFLLCLIGVTKANAEEWKIRGYYEGLLVYSGAGVAFRQPNYEIALSALMMPTFSNDPLWVPLYTTSMSRVLIREPGEFWGVIYDGVGGGLIWSSFVPWPYLTAYRSWQVRHFNCDFGIYFTAVPDWYEGEKFPKIYPVPIPYLRIGGNF